MTKKRETIIAKAFGLGMMLICLWNTNVYSQVEIEDVKVEEAVGEMTVTIKATGPLRYDAFTLTHPSRLVVDIPESTLKEPIRKEMESKISSRINCYQYSSDTVRLVVDLGQSIETKVSRSKNTLLLELSLPRKIRAKLQREKETGEREISTRKRAEEEAELGVKREAEVRLAAEREAEKLALKKAEENAREKQDRLSEERRKEEESRIAEEKGLEAKERAEEEAKLRAEREEERRLSAEREAEEKERKEEEREILARQKAEEEAKLRAEKEEEQRREKERKVKQIEGESQKKTEERAIRAITEEVGKKSKYKAKELAEEMELAEKQAAKESMERERRLEERKKQAERHLNLGEKYCRASQFAEAIKEFEQALTLDPENKQAKDYLSWAKEEEESQLLTLAQAKREAEERKKKEEAKQEKQTKEREKEEGIAEHIVTGRRYYSQGRFAEAISEWEEVFNLSPGHEVARDLILTAKQKQLEQEKLRARAEKELVEERRILDVTKSVHTSPVDYTEALNPEKREEVAEEKVKAAEEEKEGEKIKEKVEKKIVEAFEFDGAGLRHVLLYLAKQSGITISIDDTVLAQLEEKGSPNVTVATVNPMPLADALELILKVKGLEYIVEENYIWVTSPENIKMRKPPTTKAYKLKYPVRTIRAVELTIPEIGEED